MNTNQIIVILGLIVAIAAALAPDAFGQYALVLVALGLINGFMNPMADMAPAWLTLSQQLRCQQLPTTSMLFRW